MIIDQKIFLFINQFAGQNFYIDTLFYFFSSIVPYLFILFLVFFLLRNIKSYGWLTAEALFAGFFARYALVELVRHLVPRARPFLVLEEAKLLLPYKETMSFPSGHTAFLFGISTIVYFYNKKVGAFLYAISAMGAMARIFMGMHWPADVFVGALVGVFAGIVISEISNFLKKSLTKK